MLKNLTALSPKGWVPIILSILICTCSDEPDINKKFEYSPGTIKPGEEITIRYNSDSTDLKGKNDIKCIAYLYGYNLHNTIDIPLNRNGSTLTGKIKTTDSTLGVVLKFKTDDIIDNNEKSGYVISLTDDEGEKLPGSLAGYAAAINRWGAYYLDLDRNRGKAYLLFKEEFAAHSQMKRNFIRPYLEVIDAVRLDDRDNFINAELKELESIGNFSDEEYEILAEWYAKLENKEKTDYYEKIIEERFPKAKYLQLKKYNQFRETIDINEKIKLLREFENQFPKSIYLETMYDLTANAYRDAKEYNKSLEFLKTNKNKVSTFRFYSVVNRMLEENAKMNIALEIAKLGDERSRQEINNPSTDKPEYFSESEWLKDREYYLGLNLFGYAKVLNKLDRKKESIPLLEEAVALTKRKEGDINELYSKVLVENGKYSKALSEISQFIQAGNGTVKMKDLLREAYLNEKGTSEGFETYTSEFEDAARERMIEKLKLEMMLEPAPDFTLADLKGKKITLSELKGKTVILDFWATWCGPCLASFPGMKKAVIKYQDNPDVKFFFVNAWERVDDIKKNASEFIAKNDYPFQVLMDENNEVIEKYKVSGIPTKFIIDGSGNIRFISIGYVGSEDQLVEELSVMISLVE